MTFATAMACVALTAGCSFAPKYARPDVETSAKFKEIAGWKIAQPRDAIPRGKWWQVFSDSELNGLENNVANQNVAAALANFLAARAVLKQTRSQYFPLITSSPAATRSRISSPPSPANPTSTPFTLNQYTLPIDASWELDLWGRIRNSVKANSLEAQASLADLEGVRLSVRAEIAADYFQIRVLDSQRELLDATVLAYQESLKLTQVQQRTGIAAGQDVEQAETQLNTARAQLTDLGIQRAQLEHAIATLLGKSASAFSIPGKQLGAKPAIIPVGVPSQLLERRPDIAAAERRVAEANAKIGVARAAYFPTVSLGGSGGFQGASLVNIASGPALIWSVGGTLAQTLFDAGKSRAVTEQARAVYLGTVANYRQTVLAAFQEVEDDLSTLRILSRELQQQNEAVASSRRYLKLAEERYKSGIDTYLNVITAQTTLLNNQRTALNLRMQQMTASVQLIKALGGGWDGLHAITEVVP
jgi:NodT family efflux transporter outer membrane factor (OMF) lipoprotein